MIFDVRDRFLVSKEELTKKVRQLALDIAQHEQDVQCVTKKLQSESTRLAAYSMTVDLRQRAMVLEIRLINARSFVNSHNLSIQSSAHSGEYEELRLDFNQLFDTQGKPHVCTQDQHVR